MDGLGLAAARFTVYAALLLSAGVPLYLWLAREAGGRWLAGIATVVAIPASVWWAMESVAAMAAIPLVQLDPGMVRSVLEATPLGLVLVVRLACLLATLAALWQPFPRIAALTASLALASTAWTGHAGAGEEVAGAMHRASDIVHLLAAATWTGALALFVGVAIAGQDRAALLRQLSKFARIGSAVVLLLLLTGIANTIAITGWPPNWQGSWFLLLCMKLALFVSMLTLASCNRWWLVPAAERDSAGGLRPLRRSLLLEFMAAIGVVAIVALLGMLSPEA